MGQVIELEDEVFTKLKQNAEKDGVTPELWIEIKVMASLNGGGEKVSEAEKRKAWGNFIGAVNSSKSIVENIKDRNLPLAKRVDKVFGEVVSAKMKKIGLKTAK